MARPSHVRDALQSLLARSSRHDWSLDSLVEALHRRGVAADASSVFRGLVRLEETGFVQRVETGHGKARYETRAGHHEHVRCERCGTIAAIPGCLVDSAVDAVGASTGFRIDGHQLSFVGLCPKCA